MLFQSEIIIFYTYFWFSSRVIILVSV